MNEYPVIPSQRGDDLHNLEHADSADLILFMAGNQFMLMPKLIAAFKESYPEVAAIFYETLPPGLELNQILAGGMEYNGRTYQIQADVYSSVSRQAMQTLVAKELVNQDDYFTYLHNKLALMVKKGNPKSIHSVLDLGREDLVISQPNPDYENIADHIIAMYGQAGGQTFVEKMLQEKKADGTTLFTTVHHRETPERIIRGKADVGPVWHTEIVAAENDGLEVQGIPVAEALDQSEAINYFIAPLRQGRNPENAGKFLQFIRTETARKIFTDYGFVVPSK
ncbi:MAG TPA: substrate-binding domain-containing protein [Desulfosalsimonadaceae bacterium]|nr:substrate-binding domain-containing protein [Desulfosalsimonadaceae bacterium]